MTETRAYLLVGVVFLAAGAVLAGLVSPLEWLGLTGAGAGLASVVFGLVEVWDRWRASGDPR
ncbi:hypothetical protein O7626_39705 [Micromonospora sp. WMMD1102]|uniref:hypothetical protein n=1 Tax=Micromonospora sp. WMMD1102 TaxID=3016105 RepID=UPI0024154A91|nr:hypothetical protein [Micromonospora sp. WMMD1102]MDG4791941.1 hypothetical protein [Micromonospora sp. WMMD1102]